MTIETLTPQQLNQLFKAPLLSDSNDRGLGSPFLRLLATAGREQLSKVMAENQFIPGEVILKEGDIGQAMHIIWSGRAAVIKGSFDNATILGYRSVGEIIGEMSLLESQPRSASIVALETVRVLTITRDDFEKLLSSNPAMGLGILSTLSARLRAADDARKSSARAETQLIKQVSELQTERQQQLELERVRQDTIDLIVHDLRHPISSLYGAIKILEMVLPEAVLETNQQLLNIANANCDHLQLMVESLLDMSSMEAGQDTLQLNPVNLAQLVQEAVNQVIVLTEMEGITLTTIVPNNVPQLIVDQAKIHRILGNLLNNAIKYTPRSGAITVAVAPHPYEIIISVTDTGPGIPVTERERIFDRYTQLGGNNARSGGFGLGLAFCRLAVEAHGGKIWIEAGDDEQGSRFIFSLPLTN